jgi:hypothetical protein
VFLTKAWTKCKNIKIQDLHPLFPFHKAVIKSVLKFPAYPAGIPALFQEIERQHPKAKNTKLENFVDPNFLRELDQSGFITTLLAAR